MSKGQSCHEQYFNSNYFTILALWKLPVSKSTRPRMSHHNLLFLSQEFSPKNTLISSRYAAFLNRSVTLAWYEVTANFLGIAHQGFWEPPFPENLDQHFT